MRVRPPSWYLGFYKKRKRNLGVVVHVCNSSTPEVEAGGSRELDASLGYTVRACLKNK
jgi:hypothetical protein